MAKTESRTRSEPTKKTSYYLEIIIKLNYWILRDFSWNPGRMLQPEKTKSFRKKLNLTGKQRFRWNLIFNILVWFVVLLPLWVPIVSQTVAVYFIPAIQAVFVLMWLIVVVLASKNMCILYRLSLFIYKQNFIQDQNVYS